MTFDPLDVAQILGAATPASRRTDCLFSLKGDPAAPLRIVIQPTASCRKWIARLRDRVLCVTVWPARLLLAEGHQADTVIEIWRPNTDEWVMRGRLGAVAAMVIDGESASRGAKNGSPARDLEQNSRRPAADLRSSSGRFRGKR